MLDGGAGRSRCGEEHPANLRQSDPADQGPGSDWYVRSGREGWVLHGAGPTFDCRADQPAVGLNLFVMNAIAAKVASGMCFGAPRQTSQRWSFGS